MSGVRCATGTCALTSARGRSCAAPSDPCVSSALPSEACGSRSNAAATRNQLKKTRCDFEQVDGTAASGAGDGGDEAELSKKETAMTKNQLATFAKLRHENMSDEEKAALNETLQAVATLDWEM